MSASEDGPWSQTQNVTGTGFSIDGGLDAWHNPIGLTNPSMWALDASELHGVAAGSVLYAYSTGCKNCTLNPGHKHVGIALGEPVAGKPGNYTMSDLTPKHPIFPWAAEDPCIWRDPDSGYYHVLAHRTGDNNRCRPFSYI